MHRTSNNLWFNIENILNVHENTVHNQCLQAFQEIFNEYIFSWKCWLTSPLQRCNGWLCGSSKYWCGSNEEGSSVSICSCYPQGFEPHIGCQNCNTGWMVTLCPQDYTRDINALLALGLRPTTVKWMGNARVTQRGATTSWTQNIYSSVFSHNNIIAEYKHQQTVNTSVTDGYRHGYKHLWSVRKYNNYH